MGGFWTFGNQNPWVNNHNDLFMHFLFAISCKGQVFFPSSVADSSQMTWTGLIRGLLKTNYGVRSTPKKKPPYIVLFQGFLSG